MMRRCIPQEEVEIILAFCHTMQCGGHYNNRKTTLKVLQSGFFWPSLFKDAHQFCISCNPYQRSGNISKWNKIPLASNLVVEPFDVWGIDFMGPFPKSRSSEYILVAVDYITKWVEEMSTRTNDSKVFVSFLVKNILCRFGNLRVMISDGGSHFINRTFTNLVKKYGVLHCVATTYHPHTLGQVEVCNRQVKSILERAVKPNRED